MDDGFDCGRTAPISAYRFTKARLRGLGIILLSVVLVIGLSPNGAPAYATGRATGKPKVPVAPAGRGAVPVKIPLSAQPRHGLPKGQLPPVEPPRLKVASPPSGHAAGNAARSHAVRPDDGPPGGGTGPKATNVTLLPGLKVADTSLIAYFDGPDTPWVQGTVTLYTDADRVNPVHSGTFTFEQAETQACRQFAKYCWTLSNSDGWGLVAGTKYVVTVTLNAADGSGQVSDFTAPATPRVLPAPPQIPDSQVSSTLGAGSGGQRDAQPAIRGVGVNTATGAFTLQNVDAALSSSYAINIQADRSYSSLDKTASLMGVGWSFGYDARITPKSDGSDAVVFRAEDGTETTYTKQADGSYAPPAGSFSQLTTVAGGWQVVNPAQQRLKFDTNGRLLSVLDKRGKGVTLGYDGSGQLATLTDSGGRVVTLTVTGGRLARLGLPDGRTIFYTYANDRLHTVREPDGAISTYDYDAAGRIVKITDTLGHVQLTNGYDATSGRIVSQTDALGHVTKFEWDAGKQESKVTDPDGAFVKDGYLGNVLQYSQNGSGDVTAHRADAQGNTQVLADPQGQQIESGHDGNGNATSQSTVGSGKTEHADYDNSNNVKSFTDARGNTTTYVFNEFDQPLSVKDPLGNVTKFDYYPDTGLPKSVTDPLGHVTTMVYDAAGNKTAQIDGTGAKTSWAYDATGRQTSTTDPRGNVAGADPAKFTTTVAYDGEDRARRTTDPLGHFRLWDYDNAGRLHAYTDANSSQTVYEYDNANELTVEHDADLRVVKHEYTGAGRAKRDIDGAGDITSYTYDDAGRLKTTTAPRGNVAGANPADFTTTYTYDANGDKILDSHPNPAGGNPITTKYVYDDLHHLVAVTDALGRTTKTDYDAAGNAVTQTDSLGNVWRTGFDADNRPESATDPLGHTTTTHYDAAGRADASTTAAGEKTTVTYDAVGRVLTQVSPRGNVAGADPTKFTTTNTYDAAGNLLTSTDPLGHISSATYDVVNNVSKKVDANGHATMYTYDAENRLVTIRGPDATNANQVTTNQYDHVGHLIARTNPNGFVARYTYDAAGRPETSVDELGRIHQIGYDADSNPVQVLTARATSAGDPATRAANTITSRYDSLNRLLTRTLGNDPTYSYGYDAASQAVSLADATGQQGRTYDQDGRLSTVSRGTSSFSYDYDAAGNLTSRTLPDASQQTLTYDADNRPATLTVPAGTATYSYDADSNLTNAALPGGSAQQRVYDNADRLTNLTNLAPGAKVLSAYGIIRDPVGNVTRLDTAQAGVSHSDAFTYDAANRITAMCYSTTTCTNAQQKLSYTYDLVGNRLARSRTGTGAFKQTYTYDAANELTSTSGGPQGNITYAHDADGNQTRAGNVKTTYDLDNKVATVDNGKQKTTYTQDAAGNRLFADTAPSSGGARTRTSYQWDVNNALPLLVSEQSGTTPARSYTFNPNGNPLTLTVNGATDLYQQDPFANTAELTDLAGTILQQESVTDPFGEFNQSTPGGSGTPDPRFGFQGQYNDPLSGSYHLRARDYSTGTGQFNSVDPLAHSNADPAQSTYAFGDNNPLSNTDPSGMGCGWFSGLCKAVSHAASEVKQAVVSTVNTVVQVATDVVDKGVQLVKDTVSDIKNTYNEVKKDVVNTTKKVVHNVSDTAHKVGHWVNEHKAQIAGIAAGILVGVACEAITAGAGSIGCAALAGAVGNMVEYGVGTPTSQWSLGGFAKAGVIGAATGALGGAAGKLLGKAATSIGGKLIGRFARGAEGAEGAGGRAAAEGAESGAASQGERSAVEDAAESCVRNSFDPATPVLMADGSTKPISDVKVGDQVAATDPATGATTAKAVVQLHDNQDTELADVTVAAGDGGTQVIHTTQHHPFWDESRGRWVDAGDLKAGGYLRDAKMATQHRVLSVHNFTGSHRMLNLTVDEIHTYYVVAGSVRVLVHNCNPAQDAVSNLRSAGTVGAKRNIAGARVAIDGQDPEVLLSASGDAARAGTVPGVGTAGNPQRFIPTATGANNRFSDSEFKLLNYIANRLGPSSDSVSGTIDLHSELAVCPSCNSVISQFREAFPNVTINVTTG
jgi:RHS repeat-associated protein